MEEQGFNLVNVMNKDILEIIEVDAFDVLEDLLGEELMGKYLDITREHKLEAEGLSLWQAVEDEDLYMVQVEFKDFEDALYIPAKTEQLNLPEMEKEGE